MTTLVSPAQMYETVKLTVDALTPHLRGGHTFDLEPPFDESFVHISDSWVVRVKAIINDTEIAWHIASERYAITISRSVSFFVNEKPVNHTEVITTISAHHVPRSVISSLIIREIIGSDSIPMTSRKEAREWENIARQDADYVFRLGVNAILDGTFTADNFNELDDGDRWERIHTAAEVKVGHSLARHKETWRAARVPFQSIDVYDDALNERAQELVSTIAPKGN